MGGHGGLACYTPSAFGRSPDLHQGDARNGMGCLTSNSSRDAANTRCAALSKGMFLENGSICYKILACSYVKYS